MAEFGGWKAWGIQTSPLIYHLLQRGTVDSFAEDTVKVWWVGAGAAELKVYFSSCNAGVSTADGKGREGRTTEPFPPFSWAALCTQHVLVSGKPVTVTMRWKVDCSTITPVAKIQEQQKTPEFPRCALAENHTVFPSAFQLCRSSAQTTGIKGERVSSRLLLLLHSTWLSLRCAWKAHSRSSLPGRQQTVSQGSCFIIHLQCPSGNIQNPHTPPLFYLLRPIGGFLNKYGSPNKKFESLFCICSLGSESLRCLQLTSSTFGWLPWMLEMFSPHLNKSQAFI